jgi:hypothetical protein
LPAARDAGDGDYGAFGSEVVSVSLLAGGSADVVVGGGNCGGAAGGEISAGGVDGGGGVGCKGDCFKGGNKLGGGREVGEWSGGGERGGGNVGPLARKGGNGGFRVESVKSNRGGEGDG